MEKVFVIQDLLAANCSAWDFTIRPFENLHYVSIAFLISQLGIDSIT